ncbi:MAG TPA: hypothetical protein VIR30_00630 [Nocardioides sp.]
MSQPFSRAVAAIEVPVLVGAIVDGPRSDAVLNQGLVWLPDGSTTERYTKRHPVPFGEYVPFRSQLAGLQIGRLAMIPRGMIPGTRTQPLDVAGAQVVDLICFDVALTNPLPRKSGTAARWVTVQTSNGHLHRDRAAPTAVHDQSGAGHGDRTDGGGRVDQWHQRRNRPDRTVRSQLEPRTTDVTVAQVALVEAHTPAVQDGALIQRVLCLMGAVAVAIAAAGAVRRRRTVRRFPSTTRTRGSQSGLAAGLPSRGPA